MKEHLINAAKMTAFAANFYLLQLLVPDSAGPAMAIWPAIIAAGASLIGGASNKRAAKKANRRNRKQAEAERRLQYQMWQEGNSLFGPASMSDPGLNYFQLSKQSDDRLVELAQKHGITPRQIQEKYKKKSGLGRLLGGIFGGRSKTKYRSVLDREALINELQKKSGRPDREMFQHQLEQFRAAQPYAEVQGYEDIPALYKPMMDKSRQVSQGVFDDSLTDKRISFYQPVFDARQGVVDSRKQAEEEALQDTLGNLGAKQRQKGYTGDSLAGLQLEGRARQTSARNIGKMQKLMELQNQTDVLNQRMKGQELKMNNLGLAGQQAAREAQMRMLPVAASTDAALQAQKGMQFYKMKQGAPQLPGLPQYQQLPTNTELWAKGVGQVAGAWQAQNAQQDYMGALKDIAQINASGSPWGNQQGSPTSQRSWTPKGPGGFGGGTGG
jgi:hypothetical protein|tara:strand:- start:183 stop:1505 length:1323 start_codon:yes stop_codon:yes gene_type:complete